MNLHRFYSENISKPVTLLSGTEAHHLSQVMRLKAGEKVELFDGKGTIAIAEIKSINKKDVNLQIEDLKTFDKQSPQIVLAVSIAKGERFDWLIEKCTELGVDRIVPVVFERTVKQPKNTKILNRWNNIAISACKQSRRVFLPQIDNPTILNEAVNLLRKNYQKAHFIFGSLSKKCQSILNFNFNDNIIAFVGPEGGFTEAEENLLSENNVQAVMITQTILRVETAAIAFAAVLASMRDIQKI